METYTLNNDIVVYCVHAKSFPEGVLEAHQRLHALVKYSSGRNYFGISYPDKNGNIIYKAAMNELRQGELKEHQLEEFTIKKGQYLSVIIKDFMKDIPAIGNTFDKMIHDSRIDPRGACIEWYLNDNDVQCMVRMKD